MSRRASPLLALTALLGAFLLPSAAQAQGYNYLDYRMVNNAGDPFPYYLNDTQTAGLGVSATEAATVGAFQAWEGVGCASTAFSYEGRVSDHTQINNPEDPNDAFNVSTSFVTDPADPLYAYALGAGAALSASVALTYAGTLYQCDLYLDDTPDTGGVRPHWTTSSPTPGDGLDVQTFLAHEVGHCQGLGHSLDIDDIMRPDLSYGMEIRSPSPDDAAALCEAYPVDGRQGSPCPPATCADGLSCVTGTRADGGTFPPICAESCSPGDPNNTCPLPYFCAELEGGGGACVRADGDVTQVGKACGAQAECGSALGLCETDGVLPSGALAWPDGYCAQDCQNNPCPPESACTSFSGGGQLCMKTCELGAGDCRPGYVCAKTTAAASPICIAQCHGDIDCGSGFQCRLDDGACLPVQTPGAAIGDPCTQDAQCGFGQTCFLNGASQGVCTQNCATAAGACPAGTTCHPAGTNGELVCLRDCVTGSCASGEQCAELTTGRGCLPGCTSNGQCPVGDVCQSGECVLAAPPDAGCASCTQDAGSDAGTSDAGTSDAGTQKPPADAGTGPSSGGAFGCSAAGGAAAPLWVLLLGLGLLARKGRAWRRT